MTDGSQPAFPELHIHHFKTDEGQTNVVPRWMGGLTKREYFAGIAMQGMLFWDATVNEPEFAWKVQEITRQCVVMADALIEELNK